MTTSLFGVPKPTPHQLEALIERLGVNPNEPTTTYMCFFEEEYLPHDELVLLPRTNQGYDHRAVSNALGNNASYEEQNQLVEERTAVWVTQSLQPEIVYCGDCAQIDLTDNLFETNYDHHVCDNCFQDYSYCEDHDLHYRYDDCDGCEADRDNASRLVHDYSYRPEVKFFSLTTGGRPTILIREPRRTSVTGFELEMEAIECDVRDGAEIAQQLYGEMCYLKHDGSLDDGFEMVSHPMTRQYLEKQFNFEGLRELANVGMRSAQTSTCGLHVHINSGFFADRASSMWRFMSLFYQNAEQWGRIAGRFSENAGYAKWEKGEQGRLLNYAKGANKRGREYSHYNADRYVALNLQNRNTIELRFFKGTLRPATLRARLEAVHAAADYSMATRNNINIKACTDWSKFREFVRENGYTAFDEYATTKGV